MRFQMADDVKAVLLESLRGAREANQSRLEGVDEYDRRRPIPPTGTNLLGLVKHLGGMEYGYLGETFGRTLPRPIPGDDDVENIGDMWARADESSDDIVGWYREACAHADETVRDLDLDAMGSVPHWSENQRETTLGAMMTKVLGEECRHGGHMDIVRELIDGRAGGNHANFGDADRWWEHLALVQAAADSFAHE